MGGGVSRPLGNSHGNHAQLHRELVAHALLRREDLQDMSARGARYNTELRKLAQRAVREVEREGEDDEQVAMYSEDTRAQMRNAERNSQYFERNKMAKEDKKGKRKGGRRRD